MFRVVLLRFIGKVRNLLIVAVIVAVGTWLHAYERTAVVVLILVMLRLGLIMADAEARKASRRGR